GAAGTGIQEVTCLLDLAGVGISHAIGVGGRDTSAAVGGVMTCLAIDVLAADPATSVIVVVSKPPDPDVAKRIAASAAECGKPVLLGFVGTDATTPPGGSVQIASTLEHAARLTAERTGASFSAGPSSEPSLRT